MKLDRYASAFHSLGWTRPKCFYLKCTTQWSIHWLGRILFSCRPLVLYHCYTGLARWVQREKQSAANVLESRLFHACCVCVCVKWSISQWCMENRAPLQLPLQITQFDIIHVCDIFLLTVSVVPTYHETVSVAWFTRLRSSQGGRLG